MRRALPILLLAACAPIDRRPPFASASFVRSSARIDAAKVIAGTGPLLAGWASAPIVTPPGVPLAGYAEREGAASTGSDGPISARAFALRAGAATAVVLNADLLAVDRRIADAVRAEVRAPVFFTATHTHSGPGAYVPGLLYSLAFGDYDPRVARAVTGALVEAAREAIARLEPARAGCAEIVVPGPCRNRVERDGAVDDVLFVLALSKPGKPGEPGEHAALWSYGCHAVTRGPSSMKLSADYPGDVAATAGGLLGYMAGGVGSTNPRSPSPEALSAPLTRALSTALAAARARAVSSTRLAHVEVELPFPPIRYRLGDDLMALPIVAQAVLQPEPLHLGALSIGDADLLFMPAEISGQLTRDLRRRARRQGRRLAVLSFNGDYAGYVVPRRLHALPAERTAEQHEYETRTMSFLGPWGGDYLMNLGARLVREVRE